jgi:enterochelin esterase family protein
MSPRVEDSGALLTLPDPDGRWESVRLAYHLRAPYPDLSFERAEDGWGYWLARPDVDRLEYLIEYTDRDGESVRFVDHTNPTRVPGVFGEHSVLEFPGYREPAWLGWPVPDGSRVDVSLPHGRGLRRELPARVFSPAGLRAGEAAPILLVHDGPEMDRFAYVTRYSAAMVEAGLLPTHRVGLLAPLDRDAWYSASPAYARSLAQHAVPALLAAFPTTGRPVLVGASLGALAALHAEWLTPGTFEGLFLASGSYFTLRHDSHERPFGRFDRIASAVEHIVDCRETPTAARVAMVCGTAEENRENNEAMARALAGAGVSVDLHSFRDGHTWVGWRDAFHPWLTSLLASLWGGGREH